MPPKDSKNKQQQQQQQQHQQSVVVSTAAFSKLFLHAASHPTNVVHGALLGTFDTKKGAGDVVTVSDVIPICHEHPTKPLVEMALALVEALQQQQQPNDNQTIVVGWYTAPERLDDDRPGPAALRIVASLAASVESSCNEPILLVLRNGPLIKRVLQDGDEGKSGSKNNNDTILAFGKDFGQQWLQSIPIQINDEAKARAGAREEYQTGKRVVDLVDHWESPTLVWSAVTPSPYDK